MPSFLVLGKYLLLYAILYTFQNAVDDADWSPINSTVIVSVSGAVICIWDFARKTVEPVMMFTCKTGVHFSLVKFSKHGNVSIIFINIYHGKILNNIAE